MSRRIPTMSARATESIRIMNNNQNRYGVTCEHVSSSQSFSPSAQHLYDAATWRMYYRIIEARMKRTQTANNATAQGSNFAAEHAQSIVRETPLSSGSTTTSTHHKTLHELHENRSAFDFPRTPRRTRINSVASEASSDPNYNCQFHLEF